VPQFPLLTPYNYLECKKNMEYVLYKQKLHRKTLGTDPEPIGAAKRIK